jgi:hypothetical protein
VYGPARKRADPGNTHLPGMASGFVQAGIQAGQGRHRLGAVKAQRVAPFGQQQRCRLFADTVDAGQQIAAVAQGGILVDVIVNGLQRLLNLLLDMGNHRLDRGLHAA